MGYNYPPYPNKKRGTRLLLDIRNYLISKSLNPKKVEYLDFILIQIKLKKENIILEILLLIMK